MWIESLDLDDFGHFDRARLDGLEDGLTVVAGPQRSGKTTIMEAVRYLGYGLTTGTDVPPPTDRYDVTATVVSDGARYEVALDGYAESAVTALDRGAPERTARELFGGLRRTQYQQLYTISLDELRRDPDGLGDDVDLSSVLLEAAAGGDITDVPDLRDDLADSAKSVGGKHGRKAYDLKAPLETIQEGIEERDAATEQITTHEARTAEKASVEERIAEIKSEIDEREHEQMCLEAVVAGDDAYREFRESVADLESSDVAAVDAEDFPLDRLAEAKSLREDLEAARDALEEAEREFESATRAADPEDYRERLLASRSAIERFGHERSGWEQRAENLDRTGEELAETRRDLERDAAALGAEWDGDPLEAVRNLDADLFARDEVEQAVSRYQDAESDVAEQERSIQALEDRREELSARIETAVDGSSGASTEDVLPVAAAGSILAVIAGSGVAAAGYALAGVVATAVVLLVTGGVAYARLDPAVPAHDGVSVETLRAELEKVEADLDAERKGLADRREDLAEAESTLASVRASYGLPDGASARAVGQFHAELVALQERLATHDAAADRREENCEAFREELDEVAGTLADVGILGSGVDDQLEESSTIFSGIERAANHLERAEAVRAAAGRLDDVEAEAAAILGVWPETASVDDDEGDLATALDRFVDHGEAVQEHLRLRERRDDARERLLNQLRVGQYAEALRPVVDGSAGGGDGDAGDTEAEVDRAVSRDGGDGGDGATGGYTAAERGDDWLLEAYETVLESHGSIDDVVQRREAVDAAIEELETERKSRREERTELERELRELADDADVRAAHETIERGRRRLEPLAESYATDRIAAYLLDELHERFVERTTGPLLAEAGDIFRRITGDAYSGIDSRDEFDALDFEAVLEDGGVHRTRELSRATAEQLFLAVRLARIRRFDEPLPVLLDDSLTNFDPGHVQQTLDVVAELADEVQVLLLTCHPDLVDRVADRYDAQYWTLVGGRFDGPHGSTAPVRDAF